MSERRVFPLQGVVKDYDWGGKSLIPSLIGVANPGDKPFAELWMGAHPGGPSPLRDEPSSTLGKLIERDAVRLLGREVALKHGTLPFLFKVLDAEKMLSIQTHPDARQAKAGFAAGNPNYKDPFPKPEVQVALTPFWMLSGFRPLEEVRALFNAVPVFREMSQLPAFSARFSDGEVSSLRDLYSFMMSLDANEVESLLKAHFSRLPADELTLDKDTPDFWAVRAARLFGMRDPGIFSIYLLNLLRLEPGQGTFQEAGVLHAYLEGANMELMANSDNVLRGGLTRKPVDVPELMRVARLESSKPQVLGGVLRLDCETVYPTSAEEFELSRVELSLGRVFQAVSSSAEIWFVLDGAASLSEGGGSEEFRRGSVVFISAGAGFSWRGAAVLFRASVPCT